MQHSAGDGRKALALVDRLVQAQGRTQQPCSSRGADPGRDRTTRPRRGESERRMTWMLTATGVAFDLRFIKADAIDIADIAHHLAQINRYTGACRRPYSV